MLLVVALALWCASAGAQEFDPNLWGTNGNILGMARSGNTIYVAGNFNRVGPNTGCFVPVDRSTGRVLEPFPRVAGVLNAAISDGAGGWFLGGGITGVGGVSRTHLAHIREDGRVSKWSPAPNGWVHALALCHDTLFVAGNFSAIDGVSRRYLAALDARSGRVFDWNPDPDGLVRTLLIVGPHLYAGGDFSRIGGQDRFSLAALDRVIGQATQWNPSVRMGTGNGAVRALACVGDTLYVGGRFLWIGDEFRYNVGAIDVRTGQATEWNPHATSCLCNMHDLPPYVSDLVPAEETIYIAGHFSIVGGVDREGLAEVDRISGTPTAWDPRPGPRNADYAPTVTGLALTDRTVYVAGGFREIGGLPRYTLAEIDRMTGQATDWDPGTDVAPGILIVEGGRVYAGGVIGMVGCVERQHLAAFDATTGEPTAWNPNPNGFFMTDVAVSGDRVYVAGDFTFVGGEVRRGLAAVDTLTGRALDWTADLDDGIVSLAIIGDRLLAAGVFTQVGGTPRRSLAAFNLRTGELDSLDLKLNDDVYEVCGLGNTLYFSGYFSSVAGQERRWVAAIDLASGSLRDWYPRLDFVVSAIAVRDSTVFLGGAFQEVDGVPRERLAAVSATTGALRVDWLADAVDANPYTGRVYDLAVIGSTLYVGGDFDSLGGAIRNGLAGLDAETGRVLDWDPKLGGANVNEPLAPAIVWSLAAYGSTLYAGGLFLWTDVLPMSTLAGLSTVAEVEKPPAPLPASISLSFPFPNPSRSATTLRYALPSPAVVDLAVYDVRGRRVESVIAGKLQTAGDHEVPLRTTGWPAGFYFCRLQIGETSIARKFVVLQ
jgi:hypothetical protein